MTRDRLLLSVAAAACVLVVTFLWTAARADITWRRTWWVFQVSNGGIWAEFVGRSNASQDCGWFVRSRTSRWRWLPMYFHNDHMDYSGAFIPIWMPVSAIALIGALAFGVRCRRGRRRALHDCVKCGYDLTGISGVACPECGKAV